MGIYLIHRMVHQNGKILQRKSQVLIQKSVVASDTLTRLSEMLKMESFLENTTNLQA